MDPQMILSHLADAIGSLGNDIFWGLIVLAFATIIS